MLRMTTRERSSRSVTALGIFYLRNRRASVHGRRRWIGVAVGVACCCLVQIVCAYEPTMTTRRQPGILTGMPFMANVAARTFVDDMGRKLFLAQAPRRIVSLAPSVTEMLYAIGAGDQIVAVTGLCDYPPEALSKAKVGQLSANLETIVALQPDLVIAPHGFLSAEVLDQFERLKLPLLLLRAQSVDDIFRHITTLGRLLNRSKSANEVAARLRARLKRIKDNTEGRPTPRVLYVLNMEPLITVGPTTFIHHVIEVAGGSNVARDAVTEYPRLSMETVLARNPDVLVFPTGATEGIPESDRLSWRRWPTLSAVQSGRFFEIPSVLLDRPGPRLMDGLERLARALHPDAFPDAAFTDQP